MIDDYYAISVEDAASTALPESVRRIQTATEAYDDHGILGSPQKDVLDEVRAKVTGAEIDSSRAAREQGLVTLGAPAQKRLALAFVSLEVAGLSWTSDVLMACIVGGWTSAAMFRRPFMSMFFEIYKQFDFGKVDQASPQLCQLSRSVAEELVLMSVLSPLMAMNLSSKIGSVVFATDASDKKGAFVYADVEQDLSRALWRCGSRRGGYARLLSRTEALLAKADMMFEPAPLGPPPEHPQRPLAFRYHFIEVCGGVGGVTSALADKGWTVGPVVDLSRSPAFDIKALEVIRWLYHMVEQGLLDALMVEPPCASFSVAAQPPCRSHRVPRGFRPAEPKTRHDTTLALRALALVKLCSDAGVAVILEQPLLSKMACLDEWKYLISSHRAYESRVSACRYGSVHKKELRFLVANMLITAASLRCNHNSRHVKIEGKFSRSSTTYTCDLACALADDFHRAIQQRMTLRLDDPPPHRGLESCLMNDVLLSKTWRVGSSWRWKRKSHINILEASALARLLKVQARQAPSQRFAVGVDSHVALAAVAKGRYLRMGCGHR